MANTTLWIQAKTGDDPVDYTGVMDRKVFGAMFPVEGVLGTGQLKVRERAAGANMSVDVAPGGAFVKCDTVVNGGSYLTFEDATVNVLIPAAPSSGTRTHLIVQQIHDPQSDGGSNYNSRPELVQDTGSGADLPDSAYLLAEVLVTHGDASIQDDQITDMRNQASGPPQAGSNPFGGTTTPAGRVTIDHGMEYRPTTALIQLASTTPSGTHVNSYTPYVVSISSTQIVVEFRSTATGELAASGQAIYGYWHADR